MIKHFICRAGVISLLFIGIISLSNHVARVDRTEGAFPVRGTELFFSLTMTLILTGGLLLILEAGRLRRKNLRPLSTINLLLAGALGFGLIIFLPYFLYFL